MLTQIEIQSFIRSNYSNVILQQAQSQIGERNYRSFHLNVDLLDVIENNFKMASIIYGRYPLFIQTLEETIKELLVQHKFPIPLYGIKLSIYFERCMISKSNLKSIDFIQASINQREGALIYLKDAEIMSIKQGELYLQCWTQIWGYVCNCKQTPNHSNQFYRKKQTQSLLDIITKGATGNLKQNCKGQQVVQCDQCNMSLRFLDCDQLIYDHCQELIIMMETSALDSQIQFSNASIYKILVDKNNTGKFRKGDIFNACCFYKSSIELVKSIVNTKVSVEVNNLIYMVCSYPQQFQLTPSNNLFFKKLINVPLEQRPVTKINSINDLVCNYKNLTQAVNQIRYPYLGANSLTALKLVTLSSIFSFQANHEKLNLLIITDEVSMMIKFLQINDLSIKKFPTLYDDKTISNFFNSCQNSIVLISNPDKKEFTLINKILREEIYANLNFVLWIVCQPEVNLRKKLEINQIQIILDLTVQKNLNVCESVYVSMIDDYLDSFMEETEEDTLVATIAKRFNRSLQFDFDKELFHNSFGSMTQNQEIKEERLANDLLRRYFLKARQYKTTKLTTIETLTKIAESFTHFRYFITNKRFSQSDPNKPNNQHLSILDVILAIFIDEETSRNKFSSSNTLFADQVSKIMLNQNTSNVSIWDYELDHDYVQETKKYIPRDQLVGMVISKIFNLVYEQE